MGCGVPQNPQPTTHNLLCLQVQPLHLFGREFDVERVDGDVQFLQVARADERKGWERLAERPRERDLHRLDLLVKTVGKPQAMLLLQADATVTICHSRTRDLAAHTRRADILVAAVGRAKMITGDMVKPGAIVIDVGMNRDAAGKLCGDVDFDSAREVAGWITPVPGGVGPMTRAMLLSNVVLAAEHAAGLSSKMDYRCVPAAVFTTPEVGTVGLTEQAATEAGYKPKAARFPLQGLGRAIAIGDASGFAKIVADEGTGQVLGVHVVGAHASDVIAEGALAIRLEATVAEVARTIHAHPTLPEALMEAARSWLGQDIHA